jgi:hypothetical protein
MAKCPVHRDRMASLEIKEARNRGSTIVGCYAGCAKVDVLAAKGLTLRDLFASSDWKPSPEMRQRWADEERLRLLERQHGLTIMAQAVFPEERRYWRVVERNISVKGRALRDKLYPNEKAARERERNVRRIVDKYGLDELWACVPIARLQARMIHERRSA